MANRKNQTSTTSNTDNRVVTDNSGSTQLGAGAATSAYELDGALSGIAGNHNQITGTDPGLLAFTQEILKNNNSLQSDILGATLSTLGTRDTTASRLAAEGNKSYNDAVGAATKSMFSEKTLTIVAAIAGIAVAAISIFGGK